MVVHTDAITSAHLCMYSLENYAPNIRFWNGYLYLWYAKHLLYDRLEHIMVASLVRLPSIIHTLFNLISSFGSDFLCRTLSSNMQIQYDVLNVLGHWFIVLTTTDTHYPIDWQIIKAIALVHHISVVVCTILAAFRILLVIQT